MIAQSGEGHGLQKLALGTAQFGSDYGITNSSGQVRQEEVQKILNLARTAGLNTLDTAINYGDCESILGCCGVDGYRIMSKLPPIPGDIVNPSAWMREEVEKSLERLGIPSLPVLLLHRPTQLLESHGSSIAEGLEALRASGSVERIGISIYAPEELDVLWEIFGAFDVVQAPLNILDRRLLSSGWLDQLNRQNVEIHARSIFLQGLLLLAAEDRPEWVWQWADLWDRWDNWLQENGKSALQACIAFPLNLDGISKVIVGVDSEEQLKQILRAATQRLILEPPQLESECVELIDPRSWPVI